MSIVLNDHSIDRLSYCRTDNENKNQHSHSNQFSNPLTYKLKTLERRNLNSAARYCTVTSTSVPHAVVKDHCQIWNDTSRQNQPPRPARSRIQCAVVARPETDMETLPPRMHARVPYLAMPRPSYSSQCPEYRHTTTVPSLLIGIGPEVSERT